MSLTNKITPSGHLSDSNGKADKKPQLKRQLTLTQGVAVICGLMIGSGIYISPGGVIRGTGSTGLDLIVWILGGIISTFGALSFAELGTMYPRSGGKYVYLNEMYGEWAGFFYLWGEMIFSRPASNSIKALTFARYCVRPFFPECSAPKSVELLLAVMLVG